MTMHAGPRGTRAATAEPLAERFPTLAEVRAAARSALPAEVWDFLVGGAGQETTLRANGDAFDRWQFRPQVMNGLAVPTTATAMLGVPLTMPVLTAPFGAEGFFDSQGHLAVARANAAAGTVSIVPEAGTYSLEAVAAAAPAAARIAQLHPTGEERNFLRMLERIRAAGYSAVCITLDCPTSGWRERNLRNRLVISPQLITGNYPPDSDIAIQDIFGQLFDRDEPAWAWDQLARLMAATDLPWIAKGILTGEDAQLAIDAGASAVLVSNHGGRQLDSTPAALDQLPEVVSAVAGRAEILLDSGIRSGTDIIKALALGARAVVIGRLAATGLAAAGQEGVARVLNLLHQEMISVLTLLGRGSAADLTPDALQARQP
jgi:4-hydroxymandelate oxidase